MRILVSNDDGVFAEGIKVLASAMRKIGEVIVVAPDRNRSGASNSLTLQNPVRLNQLEPGIISVAGTPTDCVHIAITGLLEDMPAVVVSGINHGANLGDDVWYSGTVAAAIEGRFLGIPAIAMSLNGHNPTHFSTAAEVALQLVSRIKIDPLPPATILNVNVPDVPIADLQGFEITRLGTRHRAEQTVQQTDPRGQPIYWIGPVGPVEEAGPGTDFYAIQNNKVSITPLKIDLTQYEAFDQLKIWVDGMMHENLF